VAEISARAVSELREKTGAGMMDCKRALADAGGDAEKAVDLLRERGLAKAVKRGGRATSEGAIGVAGSGRAAGIVEVGCETDFVAKTEEFQRLVEMLARAVAAAETGSPDALLDAESGGRKLRDHVQEAIAKLGENIVVKRVQRLALSGPGEVGGYVHAGGKLGVIVGVCTAAPSTGAAALVKDLAMHIAAADPTPVAVTRESVAKPLVDKERDLLRRQAEQSGKPPQVVEKMVEGRLNKFFAEVVLLEQPFVKDPDKSVKQLLQEAAARWGQEVAVEDFVRFKLGETTGS